MLNIAGCLCLPEDTGPNFRLPVAAELDFDPALFEALSRDLMDESRPPRFWFVPWSCRSVDSTAFNLCSFCDVFSVVTKGSL